MYTEKKKAAGTSQEVVLEYFLSIPETYRKAALMLFENSGVFGGRRCVGTGAAVGKGETCLSAEAGPLTPRGPTVAPPS